MISISKITQSTESNAAVVIKEKAKSKIRDARARVSRSATLDGGAVIEHLGFSDGDRQLDILAQLNETVSGYIWDIFTDETFINISTSDGFFYGVIDRLKVDNGDMQMTLLIKE
jgi:hypothetical protein